MTLIALTFALLSAVIAVAGFWLSRFGDIIAERTGLSGSWIGLILMATVTSLPELATGLSAVTAAAAPNLAVGDALGSCVFNLLLFVAIDFFYRPQRMFTRASEGHVLTAGYSCILLGVVGLSVLAGPPAGGGAQPPIGPATVVIAFVYLLAVRTTFTFERRRLMEPAEPSALRFPGVTLRRAATGYAASAACVVAAGIALPYAALDLAETMGWSRTFVGTLFLAISTSLPELVVTLFAVRRGALDMAIANLLGSNLFNMVVLALDDLAYPAGPLLGHVSTAHAATALAALAMNGVIVASLIYRPAGRPLGTVSWASVGLVAIYVVNAWLLFSGVQAGHG
ncbi:MAG: sodium:calcium antiporter [Phenylobacterium sp.]|uniref:sodium:calcium antiporter n=1 Tax=Phenylobacterium sp. TaxID=1871053 RepID=UPI00391DEE5B